MRSYGIPFEKLKYTEFSTHAVILSERSESKDLRTSFSLCSYPVQRSFDFAPFGRFAQDDTLWEDSQLLTPHSSLLNHITSSSLPPVA